MSKKKRIDLSTELADLIMGDEVEGSVSSQSQSTRVMSAEKDNDPDPTIAISKNANNLSGLGDKGDDKTDAQAADELSEFFSSAPKNVEPIFSTKLQTKQRSHSEVILTADASLVQSDHLRIAQERILELEKMVNDLRSENEGLLAAGETLRHRNEDLKAQAENVQNISKEKSESHHEELVALKTSFAAKSDELIRAKNKIEELETRLSGDIKRIRVRERELENRLELMKLEGQAVIKNKDEVALDLKRKIDQLNFELDNYRNKGKELNRVLDDNRERVRRTVKALRLALSMLEGDDEETSHLKKAE